MDTDSFVRFADPAHRIRLVEMGKSFFQDKAAKVKAKYKVMNTQRTKILKAAKTAKLKKSSSSDNRLGTFCLK